MGKTKRIYQKPRRKRNKIPMQCAWPTPFTPPNDPPAVAEGKATKVRGRFENISATPTDQWNITVGDFSKSMQIYSGIFSRFVLTSVAFWGPDDNGTKMRVEDLTSFRQIADSGTRGSSRAKAGWRYSSTAQKIYSFNASSTELIFAAANATIVVFNAVAWA